MKFPPKLPVPILLFSLLLISLQSVAQVGINTTNPKATLDVESTNSGILIPRVALSATNTAAPIVTPEVSELIYNTATAGTVPNNVIPGFYYWNGSKWISLNTSGAAADPNNKWDLSGNSGTTPGTNFLGTTDGMALQFKTDNTTRLTLPTANQIHANSRGTALLPFYSFTDDADTGLFSPAANFFSIATSGLERFRVGNDGTGQNYIKSYLNHRFIDGSSSSPSITFDTQRSMGLYKAAANVLGLSSNGIERMRVSDAGVGIGVTANPTEKLQVNGNIRLDGALKPNNNAGTVGQVLLSAGDGQAPTWGPKMSNVSQVIRYNVGPNTYNSYTDYSLTVTVPDITLGASVIVNIRGPWQDEIYADITIHNVEIRTGEIRIALSNNSSSSYQNMILNLTVIQ